MLSKLAALATIALGGVIVADLVIHPKGTGVVLTGMNRLSRTAINGMLGKTS